MRSRVLGSRLSRVDRKLVKNTPYAACLAALAQRGESWHTGRTRARVVLQEVGDFVGHGVALAYNATWGNGLWWIPCRT